jgi:cytochrome c biogenesis protein CcdA
MKVVATCLAASFAISWWIGLKTIILYLSFATICGALGSLVVAASTKVKEERRAWNGIAGLLGVLFLGLLFAAVQWEEPPISEATGRDRAMTSAGTPAIHGPPSVTSENSTLRRPLSESEDSSADKPPVHSKQSVVMLVSWIYQEFGWPGIVIAIALGLWYLRVRNSPGA